MTSKDQYRTFSYEFEPATESQGPQMILTKIRPNQHRKDSAQSMPLQIIMTKISPNQHRKDSAQTLPLQEKKSDRIVCDLSRVHACTTDMRGLRNLCFDHRYFCLKLYGSKSRKIYFTKFDSMTSCLKQIHQHQGFGSKRMTQFKEIKTLLEPKSDDEWGRKLMKHRRSGRVYEVQVIFSTISGVFLDLAIREQLIIHLCRKVKGIT